MKSSKIKLFLLIIFPFIFLAPFTLKLIDVGNDFEIYYFTYKKYIFELLKNGHIPLWSPAEAAGYSLIFNPLTQFFYLPSWIHYLISFFIGDLSKYSFLIYTISAISIFNVGLYKYLKTFQISEEFILTAILITSVSLKLTELLRFPNALHAFAWFPWVLYGINSSQIKLNSKKNYLVILISSFMIFTAGYPYYILYGLILFSVYILFLLIIKNKNNIYGTYNLNFVSNITFFIQVSLPAIFAAILFSPIYLKTSELMEITRDRNLSDINFSLHGSSNLYDQIGSWVYPPFSFAEGWYYFGATSVYILIVSVLLYFFSKKNLFNENISYKILTIFFVFLLFLNYQFANSKDSIIFHYIWQFLEPIQNFRFWIRINVILLPIIALMLALSLQNILKVINNIEKVSLKKINLIMVFSIILILTIQFYFINYSDYKNFYWETWQLKRIDTVISSIPLFFGTIIGLYKNYIYSIFFVIIFLVLIIILNNKNILLKFNKNNNFLLIIILILTFGEMFFISNIQWAIPHNYYENGYEKLNLKKNYNSPNNEALNDLVNAFKDKRVALQKSGTRGFHGNTYYRHNKKFNINYINHWGNNNHTIIFDKFFNNDGTFKSNLDKSLIDDVKYFYGMDESKKKIFYTQNILHNNIESFIKDSRLNEKKFKFSYNLIKYNGDQLIIDVNITEPGWISFIDTWDPNWDVFVNGEKKNINKLFSAYKAIKVQPGNTNIKFEYKPFKIN